MPLGKALLVAAVLVGAAACSDDMQESTTTSVASDETAAPATTTAPPADPYEGYESEIYAGGENWLCRPDADDICDTSLDATAVAADGSIEVIPGEPAVDPEVDCFYVYPTISADPGPVADLEPAEAQEGNAALNQASRFSSLCRVFAPVYRQVTLAGLGGVASDEDREVAYADVLDAWKQYVSNDNEGRGVVLIGHSQGSGHLRRLIAEEIDGEEALQPRLISAVLLGSAVGGEDFETIEPCTAEGEVGCVISYATFRATAPPPPDTYFGVIEGDDRAACTNPAALAGGSAEVTPYFPTVGATPFSGEGPEITTEWITYPDFLTAECVSEGEVDWLELTIASDPADPRTDDIPGDLTPQWGLHLVDANIAMGDLVDLVGTQVDAYVG